jgi:hypothetical protein
MRAIGNGIRLKATTGFGQSRRQVSQQRSLAAPVWHELPSSLPSGTDSL